MVRTALYNAGEWYVRPVPLPSLHRCAVTVTAPAKWAIKMIALRRSDDHLPSSEFRDHMLARSFAMNPPVSLWNVRDKMEERQKDNASVLWCLSFESLNAAAVSHRWGRKVDRHTKQTNRHPPNAPTHPLHQGHLTFASHCMHFKAAGGKQATKQAATAAQPSSSRSRS